MPCVQRFKKSTTMSSLEGYRQTITLPEKTLAGNCSGSVDNSVEILLFRFDATSLMADQ